MALALKISGVGVGISMLTPVPQVLTSVSNVVPSPGTPSANMSALIILVQDGTGMHQPTWNAAFVGVPVPLRNSDIQPSTYSPFLFVAAQLLLGSPATLTWVWLYLPGLNIGITLP